MQPSACMLLPPTERSSLTVSRPAPPPDPRHGGGPAGPARLLLQRRRGPLHPVGREPRRRQQLHPAAARRPGEPGVHPDARAPGGHHPALRLRPGRRPPGVLRRELRQPAPRLLRRLCRLHRRGVAARRLDRRRQRSGWYARAGERRLRRRRPGQRARGRRLRVVLLGPGQLPVPGERRLAAGLRAKLPAAVAGAPREPRGRPLHRHLHGVQGRAAGDGRRVPHRPLPAGADGDGLRPGLAAAAQAQPVGAHRPRGLRLFLRPEVAPRPLAPGGRPSGGPGGHRRRRPHPALLPDLLLPPERPRAALAVRLQPHGRGRRRRRLRGGARGHRGGAPRRRRRRARPPRGVRRRRGRGAGRPGVWCRLLHRVHALGGGLGRGRRRAAALPVPVLCRRAGQRGGAGGAVALPAGGDHHGDAPGGAGGRRRGRHRAAVRGPSWPPFPSSHAALLQPP